MIADLTSGNKDYHGQVGSPNINPTTRATLDCRADIFFRLDHAHMIIWPRELFTRFATGAFARLCCGLHELRGVLCVALFPMFEVRWL
jgi:hypothetical protein